VNHFWRQGAGIEVSQRVVDMGGITKANDGARNMRVAQDETHSDLPEMRLRAENIAQLLNSLLIVL
jgi:hypothetical protein